MIWAALGCGSALETDDEPGTAPDWYDGEGESDACPEGYVLAEDGNCYLVGDSGDEGCSVTIRSTTPTTGSADAYYRGAIEFELSATDPTAQIVTDIPGSQSVRGDKTIVWTPSAPLDPSTSYEATLHYCGGDATIDFTTSALGRPLDVDESDLVGRTYNLALADARVVEPAGIGSLLGQYLTVDILVSVSSADAEQIEMIGTLSREDSDPPTQDFCNPTIPFSAGAFGDSPYFRFAGEGQAVIVASGYPVTIEDPEFSGTFAPDGSYFGGATLAGTIDTRAYDSLTGDAAEEGAVCELAPSFGVACEECPGRPDEVFCLGILIDSIQADEVGGVAVVGMSGYDCTTADDPDGTEGTNACESWSPETLPAEADVVCAEEPAASPACAVVSLLSVGGTALSLFALRRRRTP